jgi:hypothetical protein
VGGRAKKKIKVGRGGGRMGALKEIKKKER